MSTSSSLAALTKALSSSSPGGVFSGLVHALDVEKSICIEGLWDAPKAFLLSHLLRHFNKPILVVFSDKDENRVLDNLEYFGAGTLFEFPAWETLPGEELLPSPDIVGRRFEILHHLLQEKKEPFLLFASLQAVLQKLPSPDTLRPSCNLWRVGDEIPFNALDSFLEALGYRKETVVADKGQYAIRIGILDIFPLASTDPYRIEFFGDEIASIRTFDPIGQKSIQKKEEIFLCPASEPQLLKEEKNLCTLFEYLGKDRIVIFDDLLALEDRYVAFKSLPGSQTRFFATIEEILTEATKTKHLFFTKETLEELSEKPRKDRGGRAFYGQGGKVSIELDMFSSSFRTCRIHHPFVRVADYFSLSEEVSATSAEEILRGIHRYENTPLELHLLNTTESEETALKERILELDVILPEKSYFDRGYLSSGFVLPELQYALIPHAELSHRFRVRRQKWRGTYHTPAAEFHELKVGDLVVHFHNGIGKYLGVETRPNHLNVPSEFLVIEYASASKLYVPISASYLVSRYIGGTEEVPTLSQLGTQKWQKTRVQVQQAIVGYAEEMLRRHAEREMHGGFSYIADSSLMQRFESDFPYIETEDQIQAITAVKQDMQSAKAMDRLICGDVGYGKTEVAMRAAFKAVIDGGKQVAILVPTTVLAMQHFETFSQRMEGYPIQVGVVSRFMPPSKVKECIAKAKTGEIDILIGTHRIISQDVTFKDLGLIIIDEEQRFGVRAKEHLKMLKTGVDCLTLSATPIPRTLYLSLVGARDVSIISTPPQDRLPIKSYIAPRQPELIKQALLRELSRDGQAYFIHNRVESIDKTKDELQALIPEARITIGHGQMSADELDRIYHLFKNGEVDILVATTIVANGVDIPNANTILIDRAGDFGLADLYQLRGRVGRWNRPAYAYFLVPDKRELSEISRKRLEALIQASGYGGGMKIAMKDLEIRGGGDILGVRQSGQMSSIGFHLYCKLLKKAIEALKKKRSPSFIETKMEFAIDARLSEEYIYEPSLRMEFYHRLGEASSDQEVEEILKEMEDRFGKPPHPVIWLCALTKIRIYAAQLGITALKFDKFTLTIEKQAGDKKGTGQNSKKVVSVPKSQNPKEFEELTKQLLFSS